MSFTVVINTYNRVRSLRDTIDGLRRQTFRDFEVVVVNGPSTDATAEYLRSLDGVRVAACPERHLARSRNIGLAAAGGDIVAFIDDDAVPEPAWLEDLSGAYTDDRVGGAGGVVLDHTGVRFQYRFSLCDRTGRPDFDREPPLDAFVAPGADPFLYLQGTNCSFRRRALAEIGGFDEEIEYNFDETEVCLRLLDAGWRLVALDGARVHHRFLPSDRRSERAFTDPFFEVKNRVYFALSHGLRTRPPAKVVEVLDRHVEHLLATAREAADEGRLTDGQLQRYLRRAGAGYYVGLRRGFDARRASATVGEGPPLTRFPVAVRRTGRRVVVVDAPLETAAQLDAAGDEVHVLRAAPPGSPYRVDFVEGVWVRHAPLNRRWLPEVDADEPLRARLERHAAFHGALRDVLDVGPADLDDPRGLCDVEAAVACARLDAGSAQAVVRRLVDPALFPVDWEMRLRPCFEPADDGAFVECAFRALFDRPPDPVGAHAAGERLRNGSSRRDVVAWMLSGVEARGRGARPEIAERLPVVDGREARAGIRAAWIHDDSQAFARQAHELLVGRPMDSDVAPDVGDRRAWLRQMGRRLDVRDRVAAVEALPEIDAMTRSELAGALRRLRRLPDAQFVDAVYELLLGRPADPGGREAYVAWLARGGTRRHVVQDIGRSEEARRFGGAGVAAAELAAQRSMSPTGLRRAEALATKIRRRAAGRAGVRP